MPELPEMETYKRLLMSQINNKMITAVEVNREKSINLPVELFQHAISHQVIYNIERRAKYLLFHLSSGKRLVLHLMLGGFMFLGSELEKPKRSVQIKLSFGDQHLYFIGLRLGFLHLLTHVEAAEKLSHIGPDPFGHKFTLPFFTNIAGQKRGMIKSALIDQSYIAGIGNCYADEICFHARLLPMKKWNELTSEQTTSLYHSIHFILQEAIQFGGYMETPLYIGDTLTGGYNEMCKVYDREGEPCFRCGKPIILEMISSRKVFYCNHCQH